LKIFWRMFWFSLKSTSSWNSFERRLVFMHFESSKLLMKFISSRVTLRSCSKLFFVTRWHLNSCLREASTIACQCFFFVSFSFRVKSSICKSLHVALIRVRFWLIWLKRSDNCW
jgi:hypothetical protein